MELVPGGRALEHWCRRNALLPIKSVAEVIFKCAEAPDYPPERVSCTGT